MKLSRRIKDAPRIEGETLRLWCDGNWRFGSWDELDGVWRSTIDPDVILRPTHYMPMPAHADLPHSR